ncbi:roadblock/LC7 domain-containing protein [Streptomyces sp. F63]|uniref:roadblock/LC7 domain-containing protein n=1 Tax=Streptomyces sp. F63 TaxID=2824887 RepID=UPI001B36F7C9|nr:roadblock/LC7 domain-containing protein [Streptomyces sp. F63]MBQ0986879.1 roadblock/LC7 domain-containing protein [Streptomyces sp. F63]
MTEHTADTVDMTWALNELARERGVVNVLLFTSDGLLLAASDGLSRDDAERACAAFSGMKALNQDLSGFCGLDEGDGEGRLTWRHIVSDMKDHTVLVFAAGRRTGVAVSVRGDSMSQEVAVAITATMKMIRGLRPVLEARERPAPAGTS